MNLFMLPFRIPKMPCGWDLIMGYHGWKYLRLLQNSHCNQGLVPAFLPYEDLAVSYTLVPLMDFCNMIVRNNFLNPYQVFLKIRYFLSCLMEMNYSFPEMDYLP